MSTKKWIEQNLQGLSAKTVAITGATGGLGTELCLHLASIGAKLILLNRNTSKSMALDRLIKRAHPSTEIIHIHLDLEDVQSVKSATEQLLVCPPDVLILNAGAYHIPRHVCQTGYDNVWQINFLSPYYMARNLKSAIQEKGGKIIAVSSIAHQYSKIDADDVDFRKKDKSSLVYGNAKRYLTYALLELFSESNGLSIVHPGIALTNITAHYPKVIFALIKYPMKVIFMSPKRACLSVLYGAVATRNKNEWIGPRFFDVWGLPKKKRLNTANAEEIKEICRIANDAYNKMSNI